jgi:hypothetical protein
MRLLFLSAMALLLVGCNDSPERLYLYGPTKQCIAKGVSECKRIKPYDALDIKVLVDRQEVSFSQAAINLDAKNTIFRRLENCKVLSSLSFSCDGLTRTDGVFTDASVFGAKQISRSYWAYWFSYFSEQRGSDSITIQWWNDNHGWISMVVPSLIIFGLIGLISG